VTTNLFEDGEPMRNHEVHRQLQRRLIALPGVQAAAVAMAVPLHSAFGYSLELPESGQMMGETPYMNAVDPSYLKVLGLRVVAGRPFGDADNRADAAKVALVNEAMARRLWPGQSALGRCFYLGSRKEGCVHVVGVINDGHMFVGRVAASYLVPIEQFSESTSARALLVRTGQEAAGTLDMIRREARAAGTNLPYIAVWPLKDVFEPILRPWRLGAAVFTAFGLLALATAAVGMAAVTWYAVRRRHRELGIRLALGGRPGQMVRLVLARTAVSVCLGGVAGLAGAYAASGALQSLLFGIEARDLGVHAAAGTVMLVVAVIAAWLPARRAATVDPAMLLRTE
jgi:hypothetical protein